MKNEKIDKILSNANCLFFAGIGGISMSAIAKYFFYSGVKVLGSDKNQSDITKNLEKLNIEISYRKNCKLLKNVDAIIYTSAIDENSFELKYCKENHIPIIKRVEALEYITKQFESSVAICGSHGKTTTTAHLRNLEVIKRHL